MTSKICYMNDEQKNITVRIMDNRYDPVTGTGDLYFILEPAQLMMFELYIPADHVLFVKKWNDMVMISHIDPTGFSRFRAPLPSKDAA